MERKATFAVKNAKPNSSAHSSRESKPKYLIETDVNFNKNFYGRAKHYTDDDQFREFAKSIYSEEIKQKMQSKQIKSLIKETVITARPDYTAGDIIELFDSLRKTMGGGYHLLELAGHFDEGHFERVEDGWENLAYYPSKDIMMKEDGNWYIKRNEMLPGSHTNDFDVLADMKNFKKVLNIHWHAKYTNFNIETGKTARFTKAQVSGDVRLKFVADFLELRYAPEEKIPFAQSINSIKSQHHTKRQEKYKQIIEKQKLAAENRINIDESKLMLEASRANHKEDAEVAFHTSVEYEIIKREKQYLEEDNEELESKVESLQQERDVFINQINIVVRLLGLNKIESVEDLKKIEKQIRDAQNMGGENYIGSPSNNLE